MFDLELLALDLESTASWRREKAIEFPDDQRNVDAADRLEKLAEEIREVKGSLLHARFSRIVERFAEPETVEEENEYRRRVGFCSFPASGQEYLQKLIKIYQQRSERAESLVND